MKLFFIGLLTLVSLSTFANDRECKVYLDGQITGYFAPSPGQPSPLPITQGYTYTSSQSDADVIARIVRSSKVGVGIFGLPGSGRQDSVHLVLLDSQNKQVAKSELSSCHLSKEDLTFYQGCDLSNPTYARMALKKIDSAVKKLNCNP